MRARVPTPRESKISELKKESMHLPRPYKLRRYYTPAEVAKHNIASDCWVSKFNKVFDLTLLLHTNKGKPECDPIALAAGTDITHWFDSNSENVSLQPRLTYFSPKRTSTRSQALRRSSVQPGDICMCHLLLLTLTGTLQNSVFPGGWTNKSTASAS